jgi:hypothetical protein
MPFWETFFLSSVGRSPERLTALANCGLAVIKLLLGLIALLHRIL